MKHSSLIFLFMIATGLSQAQTLKKYAIGASGCSAYFFCDPGTFSLDKSADSSDVYTGECANGDMNYGIICVKLAGRINDMQESENMLIAYLDYLKKTLNITSAAGYGKGHRLKNKEDTRGVIDYWKNNEGENWKIKGWTNGKYIAVMYTYSKKEINESKANIFLDGLVLP